jgi:hypothetical protein
VVIADAVLCYTANAGGRTRILFRFIEVDRSTMPVADLANKLRAYARLFHYHPSQGRHTSGVGAGGWRDRYPMFPAVLVVMCAPEGPQIWRRVQRLLYLCRNEYELAPRWGFGISVTTFSELGTYGPHAPIFWPVGAAGPTDIFGRRSPDPSVVGSGEPDDEGRLAKR